MKEKRNYATEIKESRKTCRIPLRFLINSESEEINVEGWTAEYAGRFYEGVALNIDTCGMLIATNRVPILGEKVSALFKLKGFVEKIKADGEIVWTNEHCPHYPKGFAIKFTDITLNAKSLKEGIENSSEEVVLKVDLLKIPD